MKLLGLGGNFFYEQEVFLASEDKRMWRREDGTHNRILWIVGGGFTALLALLKGYSLVGGFDIWWHLKAGELAWEAKALLKTDVFSFSFYGESWKYQDVVSDVILYLGFQKMAYLWFALLEGLVVISLAASVFFGMEKKCRSPLLFIIATGLMLTAIHYRIIARPLVFSLMIFPIFTLLIARAQRTLSHNEVAIKKVLFALLPLSIATGGWLFFHRAAVLGYAIFGVWTLSAIASRLFGKIRWLHFVFGKPMAVSRLLLVALSLLLAVGIGALNPYGLKVFFLSLDVAESEMLKKYITEWAPLSLLEMVTQFPVFSFLMVVLISLAGNGIYRLKAKGVSPNYPLVFLLLFLALLGLTFRSVRWLPYAAVFGTIVHISALAEMVVRLEMRLDLPARTKTLLVLLAAILMIAVFHGQNRFDYGFGEKGWYPKGAVAFAKQSGLKGPVVNAFHTAGYLIYHMWPDVKVLADGRNDAVYPPEFMVQVFESQKRKSAFDNLEQARIADWVVASNLLGHLSHLYLADDPAWMMVFWSEEAVIYAKREAHSHLASRAFRYIHPASVDGSIARAMMHAGQNTNITDQIEREVMRLVTASPKGLRANVARAVYYHFKGRAFHARRDRVMNTLESEFGDDPSLVELRERFGLK